MGGGEREENFLERQEAEQSPGRLLHAFSFWNVIVVGKGDPVSTAALTADNAFSRGLADAPDKTLPLFADVEGRTVYAGQKDAIEKFIADAPIELKPIEVILDDNNVYTLLSLTERSARFAFNICPTGAPQEAAPALVDYLRKRHPRPADAI